MRLNLNKKIFIYRCLVFCLFFVPICRAQNDAALMVGGGIGASFWYFEKKSEMLEMQASVLGSYKFVSAELDYSAQPRSYFGFKSKLISMAGFNTNLNKNFVANIMGGYGYFSGTRFRSYEDSDPLRIVFYPNRFNLVGKAGIYYKFGVMKNYALGINIFFTSDKYNYAIHYGTVYVVNYNFTMLANISYIF